MSRSRIVSRTRSHSWPILAILALALLAVIPSAMSASAASAGSTTPKPTVVLVHGAFADASGWSGVIGRLQKDGYPVIAPANPLRSLSGDSAYIASVLQQTPGPLVVVGHSYGGAVITNAAAGDGNVKALVYVDAFIPAVGEKTVDLGGVDSELPTAIEFKGFPPFGSADVDIYLKKDRLRAVFAADVSEKTAAVMWASQRPLAAATGAEPTTAEAWRTIPSWALIGRQDRTITPDALRSMATRARAQVVEIDSSHVPMISHPDAVTDVIERAAEAAN
jgi:pimeloyl-ACP methyl ester carboxylesterase